MATARLFLAVLLSSSFAAVATAGGIDKGGCVAVPKDKCGTEWFDSCLSCGTASSFDCVKCCPGCSLTSKGVYSYCECKGPGPAPGPSPDTWQSYTVDGMDVLSVTGGKDQDAYDKVVVLLHGGGGSGSDWRYQYNAGWFGNLTGMKYVFPTSRFPSHVWYHDYKRPNCGLADDCAYNLTSIREAGGWVRALLEHERALAPIGGDASKVFLAGFSEGAQLTAYMQIANLDYALGGAVVMDGYPLPPLCDMPGAAPAAAKANATYYGQDMRWMIYHGDDDPIFPVNLTINAYKGIFKALGATSTIKVLHTEPGMTHTVIQPEFQQMVEFIRG